MKQTRAIIFANGRIEDIEKLRSILMTEDLIIAADGGLRYLNQLGALPQLLIGDLDSVNPDQIESIQTSGVEIKKYSVDKDQTDLQLALDFAISAGCQQIVIAGALGGRLDHTLGNLLLLTRPDLRDKNVRLDDGTEEVFLIWTSAEISGQAGDRVSLLPYGKRAEGVTTKNLKYPLHCELLNPDETRGISNMMVTDKAQVTLAEGVLICIHTRQ